MAGTRNEEKGALFAAASAETWIFFFFVHRPNSLSRSRKAVDRCPLIRAPGEAEEFFGGDRPLQGPFRSPQHMVNHRQGSVLTWLFWETGAGDVPVSYGWRKPPGAETDPSLLEKPQPLGGPCKRHSSPDSVGRDCIPKDLCSPKVGEGPLHCGGLSAHRSEVSKVRPKGFSSTGRSKQD